MEGTAHGPRKNPLDLGGNPDHVTFAAVDVPPPPRTSYLEELCYSLARAESHPAILGRGMVYPTIFNSD